MRRFFPGILLLVIVAALLSAAIFWPRSSPPEFPEAVSTNQVSIEDFAFKPPSIVQFQGTTVTWTNNDEVTHTVTSASFDSGYLSPGQTFSYTFSTSAKYDYYCGLHPSMKGDVVIKPPMEGVAVIK